ncbi:MAG: protein-export chaperone SecB [Rhodovibrionaceae bacterium]
MSDQAQTPQNVGGGAAPEAPQMTIHSQYVRDLSFESPNTPGVLGELKDSPEIQISLDSAARRFKERLFEIVLKLKVTSTLGGKTGFIAELEYAGLVSIAEEVPDNRLEQLLMVDAPTQLFPFARQIIADATRNGGFPPLLVNPIDFNVLLQQKKAQQAQEAAKGNGAQAESGAEAGKKAGEKDGEAKA